MTRFARAKGSKASNERHPEEATPWHVMKQDIEVANSLKKNGDEEKLKSAKELLKEKDDIYYTTTVGNVNTDWAEFETPSHKKSKKESTEKAVVLSIKEEGNNNINAPQKTEDTSTPNEKSCKRPSTEALSVGECSDKSSTTTNVVKLSLSTKRKMKEYKNNKEPLSSNMPDASTSENLPIKNEKTQKSNDIEKVKESSMKLSKRQKRNRKNRIKATNDDKLVEDKIENRDTPGVFNTNGNDWSNDIKFGGSKQKTDPESNTTNSIENQNKFENRQHLNNSSAHSLKNSNKFNGRTNEKKRKPPKIRDDKEHKRRKPDPGLIKVIINGMEVEITMYEGFPVKKEDAERLKDVRQQMVMKGIPKSEINMAMKLERRKAEKALARIKKNVCFHCRKAGHNLSDCPELSKEETATGICFKCGSTEHTHFECKVTKKAEFRFASCFICREQGHIAKQCPDNPKGLYPNGGACKICGDVTHLKKDCPDLTTTKEENTITLNTIDEGTLESLDDEKIKKSEDNKNSKNKIVKF